MNRGAWGDVTDVGLRTTRIRTRDNRMVIVPNSIISNNRVINYSYPDLRYHIETHVNIASIVSPHIADNVNLLVDQQMSDRLSRTFKSQEPDGGRSDGDLLAQGPILDEE